MGSGAPSMKRWRNSTFWAPCEKPPGWIHLSAPHRERLPLYSLRVREVGETEEERGSSKGCEPKWPPAVVHFWTSTLVLKHNKWIFSRFTLAAPLFFFFSRSIFDGMGSGAPSMKRWRNSTFWAPCEKPPGWIHLSAPHKERLPLYSLPPLLGELGHFLYVLPPLRWCAKPLHWVYGWVCQGLQTRRGPFPTQSLKEIEFKTRGAIGQIGLGFHSIYVHLQTKLRSK